MAYFITQKQINAKFDRRILRDDRRSHEDEKLQQNTESQNAHLIKKYKAFYPKPTLVDDNNFQKTQAYCYETFNRYAQTLAKSNISNNRMSIMP